MGAGALERLTFSGCGEEAKAILRLVIAARLRDYSARQEPQAAAPSGAESASTVREALLNEFAARDVLASVVKRVSSVGSAARRLFARVTAT